MSASPGRWTRHPADVARAVLAGIVLAVLVALAAAAPESLKGISADLARLAARLPDTVSAVLLGIGQLLAVVVPPVVALALVWRRRWRLLVVSAAAASVAALAMALLQDWIDRAVPPVVLQLDDMDSFVTGAAFPSAAFLAGAAASATVLVPTLPRRWRRSVWGLIGVGVFLRMVTAVVVPLNAGVSVALGVLVGAIVLLILGSPVRLLDVQGVLATVRRHGVEAASIEEVDAGAAHARTFVVSTGASPAGFVKVVGRDERNGDVLVRVWRTIRLKGMEDQNPGLSPIDVVEHEALVALLVGVGTGADGFPVPPVLAVGESDEGDGVLVSRLLDGRPLSEMTADDVDDALLHSACRQVAALHDRRVAHGWISTSHLMVSDDGGVTVVDLRWSRTGADERLLAADVAELAVSLAAVVGGSRAVAACAEVFPRERLELALSMMQKVLMSPETRAAVKSDKQLLGSVRTELQEQLGLDAFTPMPLRRVTVGGLVGLFGSIVLVLVLLAFASNWSAIVDALREADWSQMPILLVLVAITYVAGAMSLMGAVDRPPLPFLLTTEVMLGQSFLNRFTPANAGGMAMRARYLQLRGVELPVAAASVGITSGASGVMQVVLLLTFFVWAGSSGSLGLSTPDMGSIATIIALVLILLGAVYLVPAGRRFMLGSVVPAIRKVVESVWSLAKQPTKLLLLFGGAGLGKLATIIAFVVSCRAFDIDIAFAQLGFMYMTANTVASAAPTPGGVGAIEAALTAVLTARGVDPATALATVMVFRLMTYWLPVLPSYVALRHLRATEVV